MGECQIANYFVKSQSQTAAMASSRRASAKGGDDSLLNDSRRSNSEKRKISTSYDSYNFIMTIDTVTGKDLSLKLLPNTDQSTVTYITYGPYDNGYLLLGYSDGVFMAVDVTQEIKVILSL